MSKFTIDKSHFITGDNMWGTIFNAGMIILGSGLGLLFNNSWAEIPLL